jgi:hypothetical protein
MRIIKKTGLINKSVVPRKPWNATTFFSQRTTDCLSHSRNTQTNRMNTNFSNLIRFLIEKYPSFTLDITVSHNRQTEKKIFSGMFGDNHAGLAITELEFIKKFMQGSANYFSVSVKHNLGWFYHGIEKAYFSALSMEASTA